MRTYLGSLFVASSFLLPPGQSLLWDATHRAAPIKIHVHFHFQLHSTLCHHGWHTLAKEIVIGRVAPVTRVPLRLGSPHLALPTNKRICEYKINLSSVSINYIRCLLSITCNKTTCSDRSLWHGNLTYSNHTHHTTLTGLAMDVPLPCNNIVIHK